MYIPLSLLGNGSVNRYCRNEYTRNIEESLEASFSMRSVSYQGKVGEEFFSELLVVVDLYTYFIKKYGSTDDYATLVRLIAKYLQQYCRV
jgi:hypothetical protein